MGKNNDKQPKSDDKPYKTCPACGGTGGDDTYTCSTCGGEGYIDK